MGKLSVKRCHSIKGCLCVRVPGLSGCKCVCHMHVLVRDVGVGGDRGSQLGVSHMRSSGSKRQHTGTNSDAKRRCASTLIVLRDLLFYTWAGLKTLSHWKSGGNKSF